MADKRFVLVTSTGCIEWAPARYKRDDIGIIRVRLTFKGVEYEEGPQLDPVKFYQEQETIENPKDNLPSTAIPNMEKVRKQFDELYEKGYRELIIIAISSGLGGTYNALRLVSEDYESKMKITVIDSRITAFNEGLLAIKAADLVKQGVPTEQIVKEIEWIKARQEFLGVDGKLDYLIYNGRLKGGKAFMGKMLNICPVIHFSPEGEVVPLASVRTQTKALHKTCEIIKNVDIPVILGGGANSQKQINEILNRTNIEFISMQRPFVADPSFLVDWAVEGNGKSICKTCNNCYWKKTSTCHIYKKAQLNIGY